MKTKTIPVLLIGIALAIVAVSTLAASQEATGDEALVLLEDGAGELPVADSGMQGMRTFDLDGDGVPNCEDPDDDADGILDVDDEFPVDHDNDGLRDVQDDDDDNNGILDVDEVDGYVGNTPDPMEHQHKHAYKHGNGGQGGNGGGNGNGGQGGNGNGNGNGQQGQPGPHGDQCESQ